MILTVLVHHTHHTLSPVTHLTLPGRSAGGVGGVRRGLGGEGNGRRRRDGMEWRGWLSVTPVTELKRVMTAPSLLRVVNLMAGGDRRLYNTKYNTVIKESVKESVKQQRRSGGVDGVSGVEWNGPTWTNRGWLVTASYPSLPVKR
jgi:hypothetical protein